MPRRSLAKAGKRMCLPAILQSYTSATTAILVVGALAAGTYELHIRATDGQHEMIRTAYFTCRTRIPDPESLIPESVYLGFTIIYDRRFTIRDSDWGSGSGIQDWGFTIRDSRSGISD